MSELETTAYLEIGVTGLIVFIAGALFWDSLGLPESVREPLGSATIPRIVCAIVIVFCAILITRSVKVIASERAKRTTDADVSSGAEPGKKLVYRRRGDLAVQVFIIAVAYVALIQTQWISS